MSKSDEVELFDFLARQQRFREWLNGKLSAEFSVLTQALDVDQLRKAQGRAGLLQNMISLLDQAPAAVKR